MKKWMISLFSVVMLALSFSGCGGSEGSSSAVSNNGGNDNPDTPNGGENPATMKYVEDVRGLDHLPPVPAVPES